VKTGADKSAENTASQPTRQSVFPQPKAPSQNKPTVQTEYKSISSPSNTSTRTRTDEIPHSNRLQQSLSPIDEKLAPPPTSFLKKEKALENNIEIAIKPTRVKKTKIRKEKGDGLGLPKFVLPTVFGIILVTLCIVAYIFVAVKPFYEASWTANITEEEKAKGVKELSYVITPEHFKEKLISEIEGLTVSATLSRRLNARLTRSR
jgi:hypothetical protein